MWSYPQTGQLWLRTNLRELVELSEGVPRQLRVCIMRRYWQNKDGQGVSLVRRAHPSAARSTATSEWEVNETTGAQRVQPAPVRAYSISLFLSETGENMGGKKEKQYAERKISMHNLTYTAVVKSFENEASIGFHSLLLQCFYIFLYYKHFISFKGFYWQLH